MNRISPFAQSERLRQSIDIAIRRQLSLEDDPLALALYLWVAERHKVAFINSSGLVSWGVSWLRRVFIEHRIGQRRDEEIASASLAAIALIDSPLFQRIRDEVCSGVSELLSEEISRSLIPFRRPSYGVIFLLAAHKLGVDQPPIRRAARAIAQAYRESLPGGRLFGISFCVQLLQESGDQESLSDLEKPLLKAITDPRLGFEDHIYACQAVQQLRRENDSDDEMVKLIDDVVSKSPAHMYLMVGMEDMPPAGDEHVSVTVSHLYRASLLDVAIANRARILKQQELQVIARYQGSRLIGWSAFAFPTVLILGAWVILLYKIIPHLRAGVRFWFRGDDSAMPFSSALILLGAVLLLLYLMPAGAIIIRTLYSVLIRANVQSDQWIKDKLMPKLWTVTKWWAGAIVFAVILGVIVNIISPRFEHGLKVK